MTYVESYKFCFLLRQQPSVLLFPLALCCSFYPLICWAFELPGLDEWRGFFQLPVSGQDRLSERVCPVEPVAGLANVCDYSVALWLLFSLLFAFIGFCFDGLYPELQL